MSPVTAYCPVCGQIYPVILGALSRVDARTTICNNCGRAEGLLEISGQPIPWAAVIREIGGLKA